MKQENIEFPDCWDEVQPSEWLYILKLRGQLMKQPGLSLVDIKRGWTVFVLKNRGYRPHSKVDDLLLIDELAQTLDWMWLVSESDQTNKTAGTSVELVYDCTKNLLPQWRHLHGPASHGADMTFGEFRNAAAAMNKYNTDHNTVDLRALCAMLYRKPIKENGCVLREPFKQKFMGKYMGLVRDMPEWIQWGIYAWFAYFCEYLFTGTFIIDGLELCFSPLFERHSKRADAQPASLQNMGMNSVLYSVAESGIFGNVDMTDDTLLLCVMMKLLDDKQRADEMLRNLKK